MKARILTKSPLPLNFSNPSFHAFNFYKIQYKIYLQKIKLLQISIAMNDPKNFSLPQCFWPERFLTNNNNDEESLPIMKLRQRPAAFLPFSLGRRQCVGESLARAELFLIFANLLSNFKLHVPQGDMVGFLAKNCSVARISIQTLVKL